MRGQRQPAIAPTNETAERGNLPAPLTRIVGREDIVAALAAQLAQRRLLTIVGPGGIGKTTVAVAVAEKVSASYDDGVWLVGLASLPDPDLVASALARLPARSGCVGAHKKTIVGLGYRQSVSVTTICVLAPIWARHAGLAEQEPPRERTAYIAILHRFFLGLIMACRWSNLASEDGVADRGVEQHQRKDEETLSQNMKARLECGAAASSIVIENGIM